MLAALLPCAIEAEEAMAEESGATPLIALDAVAIDTETTGLDPRRAWLVEIAAVRLVGGRLETNASLRRRVRPPAPIPAAATRIHGIDDAAVSGNPPFAEVMAGVFSLHRWQRRDRTLARI